MKILLLTKDYHGNPLKKDVHGGRIDVMAPMIDNSGLVYIYIANQKFDSGAYISPAQARELATYLIEEADRAEKAK